MYYIEESPADELELYFGAHADVLRLRRWRAMEKLRLLIGIGSKAA